MEERILEFASLLRRHGLRVSLSENMDAFHALELLGVQDAYQFRTALRTTFVKRAIDLKAFEELFDLYFLGVGKALEDSDRRLMAQLGLTPREFEEMLEEVRRFLNGKEGEISALTRALLSGDMGQVERLLRDADIQGILGQSQNYFRMTAYLRVAAELGLDQVQQEMERVKSMILQAGEDPALSDPMTQYVDERMQELGRLIRELIQQELAKGGVGPAGRERSDYLSEKSFAYYTEEDIRQMNEAVTRLAQRLKNRLSVKRKQAAKGRFNVKDTLRENLQFGGVPFKIRLDRRKKEKPQVIILCDISDSVLNASRFMLQFVYSVQDLYSKVRSFVFVSDIGEVTQLFEENEIHTAIERSLKGEVIDVYSHSNFGRAFELFYRDHQSAITGKTTFLIIGDGRNNYNRPNEWVLREIQQQAKQLIWLNPESQHTWGIGDSEMPRYKPYCDVVEECRNINQLYKVIDRIVP